MTDPRFGQTVPLQSMMLRMAGEPTCIHRDTPVTEPMRVESMRSGRQELVRRTGVDFGYDLAMWHRLLSTDPRFVDEYQFPRAWSRVAKVVEARINDPEREQWVNMIMCRDKKKDATK